MGHHLPYFARQVQAFLHKQHSIDKLCTGTAQLYHGKRILKLQNGKPNQLRIDACDQEGQVAFYVYTKDCVGVAQKIRDYYRRQGVAVRG